MSLQLIREALENANAIMPCPLYKEALDAARKMDVRVLPEKLRALVPDKKMLDALDDNDRTGRRPFPFMREEYLTIKDWYGVHDWLEGKGESHVPDGPWRANVILSGYQANGYSISRDDEKPIARTILVDEVDDEAAAELIVNALNSYKGQ